MPVFNKMVYDGTEYILGGGGNIGEPLNLTVTTSGLDATITWEDNEIGTIPPTTFQKSELVRKIGSAPTSPSDGDLVETETVKDTYKNTGYVDSGLTNGETYYYRVFSYSDLGGISYCDAVDVTPSGGGWQPGVNTIAYYPLTLNANDATNNHNDMTAASAITYSEQNGAFFPDVGNSGLLTPSGFFTGTTFTFSLWVNTLGVYAYNDGKVMDMYSGSIRGTLYAYFMSGDSGPVYTEFSSSGGSARENYCPDLNTRYNYIVTLDGGVFKFYINGNIVGTVTNGSNYTPNYIRFGQEYNYAVDRHFHGYLKDVIIEDKTWTAQEVSDYFDQTKANYGIS